MNQVPRWKTTTFEIGLSINRGLWGSGVAVRVISSASPRPSPSAVSRQTEPYAKSAKDAKESFKLLFSSVVPAHLLVKILVSHKSQRLGVLCALCVRLLGLT